MILVALEDVRPGMVLGRALYNREGHTVLGAGMKLTHQYLRRLRRPGIVYCSTVKDVEELGALCKLARIPAEIYHGRLTKAERPVPARSGARATVSKYDRARERAMGRGERALKAE